MRPLKPLFPAALALLVTACAQQIVPGTMGPEESTRTLRTTYQYIQAKYLWSPQLDVYGNAGLANLASLDPALSLRDDGATTTLLLDGSPIHNFEPPPADRPDAWANTIRRTVEAAAEASPAVAAASWDRRIDVVLVGSAEALGQHAGYSSHDTIAARRETLEQNKGDLAILLADETDPPTITQVQHGSTAEAAGLRAGDILWKVDGEAVAGMPTFKIAYKLGGVPDTEVTVDVSDASGEHHRSITLRREKVNLTEPVVRRLGSMLYVQFAQMIHTTNDKVREALEADLAKGEDRATGIILDLRGAYAPQPWLVRDLVQFFHGEVSVYTSAGRDNGDWYPSWDKPLLPDIPLVVLQNGATRAAAEAVSAAFGDLERAIVVGTLSQGDGKIVTNSGLLNGGFIWFPSEEIYTAADYRISGRGVIPTICTAGEASAEEILATLRAEKGITDWHQRTRHIQPTNQTTRDSFQAVCPPNLAIEDKDLEIAMAILGDASLYDSIHAVSRRGKTTVSPPGRP